MHITTIHEVRDMPRYLAYPQTSGREGLTFVKIALEEPRPKQADIRREGARALRTEYGLSILPVDVDFHDIPDASNETPN